MDSPGLIVTIALAAIGGTWVLANALGQIRKELGEIRAALSPLVAEVKEHGAKILKLEVRKRR